MASFLIKSRCKTLRFSGRDTSREALGREKLPLPLFYICYTYSVSKAMRCGPGASACGGDVRREWLHRVFAVSSETRNPPREGEAPGFLLWGGCQIAVITATPAVLGPV